jgi:hypothetical protein
MESEHNCTLLISTDLLLEKKGTIYAQFLFIYNAEINAELYLNHLQLCYVLSNNLCG